jgi:hypothetical protein
MIDPIIKSWEAYQGVEKSQHPDFDVRALRVLIENIKLIKNEERIAKLVNDTFLHPSPPPEMRMDG